MLKRIYSVQTSTEAFMFYSASETPWLAVLSVVVGISDETFYKLRLQKCSSDSAVINGCARGKHKHCEGNKKPCASCLRRGKYERKIRIFMQKIT